MKIANLTIYRILSRMQILTSNVYEPVALTVKLTALIMMKKCCWWLNRQLIAKTKILAMKFSKNRGTSSYLKVEMIGSGGYEPPALTVKLTARTNVLYSIPEIIRFAKGVRVEIWDFFQAGVLSGGQASCRSLRQRQTASRMKTKQMIHVVGSQKQTAR